MAVDSDSLLAGRYRVQRRLGTGGMAVVFLAHDERLGREVAVKRVHAFSAEEAAQRLEREAKVGAALNHKNLVSIYDIAPDEESVLIVMEYVDGSTLADALSGGPLPRARAVEVVGCVAAALDHAHGHGVVHRDVKPANVLLARNGRVKLADLGIARAAERTRITRSGTVLGTPSYMAPEQLEGAEPTPAVDVYALAAVAYEALAGRKARSGGSPLEIAHRIATEPPPDLREAWPEAPPRAAAALERGMARDPRKRPRSAGELAGELERAFEEATVPDATLAMPRRRPAPVAAPAEVEEPAKPESPSSEVVAPPPPARPRGRASGRRERRLPVALALGLLALAVIAVALTTLGGGEDDGGRGDRAGERGPSERQRPRGDQGGRAQGGGAAGEGQGSGTSGEAPRGGSEPARVSGVPEPVGAGGAATGRRLNSQGYRLLRSGRASEAVPILRRAVAAFPPGTDDIEYAFTLYNLGRALRLSGRPAEAIPVLERRLQFPNQRETVRQELERARRAAA